MSQFKFAAITGLAAAAALAFAGPSWASTATKQAAKPVAAKPAVKPAPTMKTVAVAKPAPKARPATHVVRAHPAAGRMVQARLANGKTVTYNCSLPGNQTKQACKR